MGCGRIGAQQRASMIGRSPTPSISTGERLPPMALRDLFAAGGSARGDSSAGAAAAAPRAAEPALPAALPVPFAPDSAASSRRLKKARNLALLRGEAR